MAKESQDGGWPAESIRVMAESVGITGLSDEAVLRLGDDVVYRLKQVVQEATKFARHSKRRRLTTTDVDCALRAKNVESVYGFDSSEHVPFRHVSGGGKEVFFVEDKEVDLLDTVAAPLPRLPLEPSLRSHWLAVSGVQPVVPENPPQVSLAEQQRAASSAVHPSDVPQGPGRAHCAEEREDEEDLSKLKPLRAHSLSLEQQVYFTEITDACIGLSDQKRLEALTSLSSDPGLYQLLPYFSNFVVEGVRLNIAQKKLVPLKHLVRMVRALLDNSSISLEKCLHELIPALTSSIVSRQVCLRPEVEDHWSLKDAAAKVMATVCQRYSTTVNNIQPRYTRVLSRVLNDHLSNITMHYGAVVGLSELGTETITSVLIPKLRSEATIIQGIQQSAPANSVDDVGASKLQMLLVRCCSPALVSIRAPSDTLHAYQQDYSYLGQLLYSQVQILRKPKLPTAMGPTVTKLTRLSSTPLPILRSTAGGLPVRSPTTPTTPSPSARMRPPPLQLGGTLRSAAGSSIPRLQSPVNVSSPVSLSPAFVAAVLGMQRPSTTSSSPTLLSPAATSPPVTQPSTPRTAA